MQTKKKNNKKENAPWTMKKKKNGRRVSSFFHTLVSTLVETGEVNDAVSSAGLAHFAGSALSNTNPINLEPRGHFGSWSAVWSTKPLTKEPEDSGYEIEIPSYTAVRSLSAAIMVGFSQKYVITKKSNFIFTSTLFSGLLCSGL